MEYLFGSAVDYRLEWRAAFSIAGASCQASTAPPKQNVRLRAFMPDVIFHYAAMVRPIAS